MLKGGVKQFTPGCNLLNMITTECGKQNTEWEKLSLMTSMIPQLIMIFRSEHRSSDTGLLYGKCIWQGQGGLQDMYILILLNTEVCIRIHSIPSVWLSYTQYADTQLPPLTTVSMRVSLQAPHAREGRGRGSSWLYDIWDALTIIVTVMIYWYSYNNQHI